MSNDLIDRQAAKSKEVYSYERHEYVVPVAELDWLPSAQPAIIRCGECRHYREGEIFGKKITLCKRREYDSMYTEPDDFCSRAERREE